MEADLAAHGPALAQQHASTAAADSAEVLEAPNEPDELGNNEEDMDDVNNSDPGEDDQDSPSAVNVTAEHIFANAKRPWREAIKLYQTRGSTFSMPVIGCPADEGMPVRLQISGFIDYLLAVCAAVFLHLTNFSSLGLLHSDTRHTSF